MTTPRTPDAVASPCPKCGRAGEHVYGEATTPWDPKFPGVVFKSGYWVMYLCRLCDHRWTIQGTLPPV